MPVGNKLEVWLRVLSLGSLLGAAAAFMAAVGRVGQGGMFLVAVFLLAQSAAVFLVSTVVRARNASGEPSIVTRGAAAGSGAAGEAGGAQGSRPKLTFADVAGLDEVLGDLKELVSFIKERDRYLAMDARLPRGVLLYGPPGTGKTLLAKALAAEAEANFLYASGSSFVEKYVGVGAQRIRELFARARKQAPAVLFIDEIDSIGRSRGNSESSEWDTALNQLLTELDGFESAENILLICATNRKEMLDEALLRPGRLDRQIYIGLPDLEARKSILAVHTKKKPLAPDIDLAAVARRSPGLSGAHLAAIANEAALGATRSERKTITQADFDAAMDRVLAGQSGRSSVLSEAERRLVAYHEAGHAVVGWILGQGDIERITLLSRSQALGYVLQVPAERALHTRSHLRDRIAVLLGGRAAEELVTGDFTTGAADDLRKATGIAERMVLELGMGESRPHQVIREQSMLFSRSTAREVNRIIQEGWDRATRLVAEHRGALERLARSLLEHESLDRGEVEALLAHVPEAACAD